MKKILAILAIIMLAAAGCQEGQQAIEFVTDPNNIDAAAEITRTIGLMLGRPELIGIGVVLGGIGLAIRQIRKGS